MERSGVLLTPGTTYGEGGAGHMRINVASARVVVEDAFQAMAEALRSV